MKHWFLLFILFILCNLSSCKTSKVDFSKLVDARFNTKDSLEMHVSTETVDADTLYYNAYVVNTSKRIIVLPKSCSGCFYARFVDTAVKVKGPMVSDCYTLGGSFSRLKPKVQKKIIELPDPGQYYPDRYYLKPLDTAHYQYHDYHKYSGLKRGGTARVLVMFAPDSRYRQVSPTIWLGKVDTIVSLVVK